MEAKKQEKSKEKKEARKVKEAKPEAKVASAKSDANPAGNGMIAAVRIRGTVRVRFDMRQTMEMLRLYRNNYCVVLKKTPSILGMVKKAKDYIAWGEIDDATYRLLIEKRGELYLGRTEDSKGKIKYSRKYITIDGKNYKPFFRLSPPRKGFERKGKKKGYGEGGASGYRGSEISALIKRMI